MALRHVEGWTHSADVVNLTTNRDAAMRWTRGYFGADFLPHPRDLNR
jgi:hypothetical protein